MKGKLLGIFGIILGVLLTVGFVSAYQYVQFNGEFSQGTTLYSNWMNITSMQGKDVYPIPASCTYKTVCSYEKYHWVLNCTSYYTNGKCKTYKNIRIDDGCARYSTKTLCKYSTLPICFNVDGIATNSLHLSNFKYTLDGNNWIDVNYTRKNINSAVKVKLDIPSICIPIYDINKAIKVD